MTAISSGSFAGVADAGVQRDVAARDIVTAIDIQPSHAQNAPTRRPNILGLPRKAGATGPDGVWVNAGIPKAEYRCRLRGRGGNRLDWTGRGHRRRLLDNRGVWSAWTGPDPNDGPPIEVSVPGEDDTWASDVDANAVGPTDPAGGPCSGATRGHVVKTYAGVAFEVTMPLRCGRWDGTSGWGWRKMVALGRWSSWYDGMIGATLQNPEGTSVNGTSRTYWTQWFRQCNPVYRFRVITETRSYGGGKMGVLNAYKEIQK